MTRYRIAGQLVQSIVVSLAKNIALPVCVYLTCTWIFSLPLSFDVYRRADGCATQRRKRFPVRRALQNRAGVGDYYGIFIDRTVTVIDSCIALSL